MVRIIQRKMPVQVRTHCLKLFSFFRKKKNAPKCYHINFYVMLFFCVFCCSYLIRGCFVLTTTRLAAILSHDVRIWEAARHGAKKKQRKKRAKCRRSSKKSVVVHSMAMAYIPRKPCTIQPVYDEPNHTHICRNNIRCAFTLANVKQLYCAILFYELIICCAKAWLARIVGSVRCFFSTSFFFVRRCSFARILFPPMCGN